MSLADQPNTNRTQKTKEEKLHPVLAALNSVFTFIGFFIPSNYVDNAFRIILSNLWIYIKALAVNLIIFFVAIGTFMASKQAKDVINGIAQDGGMSLFWFWLGITLLSLSIWYTSIFALAFYDLGGLKSVIKGRNDSSRAHEGLIKFLPYLLSIGVYLIICTAFNGAEIVENPYGWYFLYIGLFLGVGLYFYREAYMRRNNFTHLIKKGPMAYDDKCAPDKLFLDAIFYLIIGIIVVGLIISSFDPKPINVPQWFNSGAIICFYLTGATLLFNIAWQKIQAEFTKFSMSFLILFLIPFFSFFNNNHKLRIKKEAEINRASLSSDFKNWISAKLDDSYSPENRFPVVFVAAEGGGIRSMKWTALLLDKFYKEQADFSQHLYAISGVSGGSVGAVFQQATLSQNGPPETEKLKQAIKNDFLAPVTFGLLIPDMIQSIVPYPIDSWDRSRWLEDAFQAAVENSMGTDVLAKSLTERWYTLGNKPAPNLSHIFLNCTVLETGQKALISDLKIPKEYFGNSIDLLEEIRNTRQEAMGIPLKTAASLSARFPLVTSAGKVELGENSLQIVDGGYHDNTGLETIFQILQMILIETDSADLNRMSFNIVLLKNSLDKDLREVESTDFVVDISAPLNTIISNWGNSTVNTINNTQNSLRSLSKLGLDIAFYPFQLDRKVIIDDNNKRVYKEDEGKQLILPLGWYLSERANTEIDRQLNAVTSPKDTVGDKMAKHNFETFQRLMEKIK